MSLPSLVEKPRLRALMALVAVALAIAAQVLLEIARVARTPVPVAALPLFAVAAVLAVTATWRREAALPGSRQLQIESPQWRWWLTCLPGAGLLLAAAFLRFQAGPGIVFLLWSSGIVALLAAGVLHALASGATGGGRGNGWSGWSVALAYVALALIALLMRTVYDFTQLPAFVQADEAFYAFNARDLWKANPFAWFDLYMVGMPQMQLVPFMLSEALFGGNLFGARMGGVIMGVVSVLGTFGFARRLSGDVVGFTAALLVAVAHTHVHFSRTAQIFIETPAAAAVVMWLFTRAWTGGGLLSWVGAGVALGIGAQTYYASYVLPFLLPVTALGWRWAARERWTSVLGMLLAVELIALLVFAPVGMEMYRQYDLAATRPRALFILSPENLERMGENPMPALLGHLGRVLVMFNTGVDDLSDYAAQRSLVDAVTASMIPLAAALVLARLLSPVGWVCAAWVATYLLIGVLLINNAPTYQRVPAALLFSSLAVAWTLAQLAAVVAEGWRLRQSLVAATCLLFATAAAAANAHFYFHEFRLARPTVHTMGLTWLVCRYADTHTIIDATTLGNREFVPRFNVFLGFECPKARRIMHDDVSTLWDVEAITDDDRVVLIVPEEAVTARQGTPKGYRVARQYVDTSIQYPYVLPLAVYELEREAAGAQPPE